MIKFSVESHSEFGQVSIYSGYSGLLMAYYYLSQGEQFKACLYKICFCLAYPDIYKFA